MKCCGIMGFLFGHRWRMRTKRTRVKNTRYYYHYYKCTRCGELTMDKEAK